MDAALRIDSISKRFRRSLALDSVSLEVPRGALYGLLGPNGAGKTTLFSIIAGFLRADAGRVEVLGRPTGHAPGIGGRLSMLPQDALFQRNVPILEQLIFFRQLDGRSRADAEAEARLALRSVGLGGRLNQNVRALSHGMIKRLGVAQAFLGAPEVILLDEPTAGLDPQNARQVRDLIAQNQGKSTVVVSSHNLTEIQELCDHAAILHEGRLIAAGSIAELTRAGRRWNVTLSRALSEAELGLVLAAPGVLAVEGRGPRYEVGLDGTREEEAMAALLRAVLDCDAVPREIREGRTLEAHFLDLVSRQDEAGAESAR